MSFHFTIVRNRLNHPLAQKTDFASYYSVTIVRRSIIVRGLVKGRRRSRETLMEETLLDFAGSCFFFLGRMEGKLCLVWVIDSRSGESLMG